MPSGRQGLPCAWLAKSLSERYPEKFRSTSYSFIIEKRTFIDRPIRRWASVSPISPKVMMDEISHRPESCRIRLHHVPSRCAGTTPGHGRDSAAAQVDDQDCVQGRQFCLPWQLRAELPTAFAGTVAAARSRPAGPCGIRVAKRACKVRIQRRQRVARGGRSPGGATSIVRSHCPARREPGRPEMRPIIPCGPIPHP